MKILTKTLLLALLVILLTTSVVAADTRDPATISGSIWGVTGGKLCFYVANKPAACTQLTGTTIPRKYSIVIPMDNIADGTKGTFKMMRPDYRGMFIFAPDIILYAGMVKTQALRKK